MDQLMCHINNYQLYSDNNRQNIQVNSDSLKTKIDKYNGIAYGDCAIQKNPVCFLKPASKNGQPSKLGTVPKYVFISNVH